MDKRKIRHLKDLLICVCCKKDKLDFFDSKIVCKSCKKEFKVFDGIPILIDEKKNDSFYHLIDKRQASSDIYEKNKDGIYKFVEENLKGTNGYLYKNKNLVSYPIPAIDVNLNNLVDKYFLDLGCGWGRWTFSSAKYTSLSIGVDVSIDSLVVANKIAIEKNLNCIFIYADIRNLPFKENLFDTIYSYSVLQHLSFFNLVKVIKSAKYTLRSKGLFKFQIMNRFGLRSFYIQLKRNFRNPQGFEVRYYNFYRLKRVFLNIYENIAFENCSFFTQARKDDFKYLTILGKVILSTSLFCNFISYKLKPLKNISDNIYISLWKK